MPRFEHSADVAAGAWIARRLAGGFGTAGRVCPTGYDAYARVFHPVNPNDGSSTRLSWAEVAAHTGRVAHPLMQWAGISGLFYGERLFGDWDGGEPQAGALEPSDLARLATAIGGDAPITIGLWVGYGDLPARVSSGPTLEMPGRDYALFHGELATLRDPGWPAASNWPSPSRETINLAWPDDRGWFVASEIDFDSTVVGGPRRLIDRVLASDLETAEIDATSDLSSEGDRINPSA